MKKLQAQSPKQGVGRVRTVGLLATTLASIPTVLIISACSRAPSQQTASSSANANTPNTQSVTLLNVSYDISRELYKKYNPIFIEQYTQQGQPIDIQQSHGGSSKQALSVANGLQADVVTMNQASDIELLVKKGLVDKNWQQALPNHSVPYTSTMVLVVRKDNPKHIKDWQDLAKAEVKVVMPNPKTSGTGRYAFLGAYGYGLHTFNHQEDKSNTLLRQILANVATFDSGSRGATTTFAQSGIGDVLITTENEAHTTIEQFASDNLQIIYPSYSVKIDNPVAVVSAVTEKKGTTAIAHAYLKGLWSPQAQQVMAQNYLRPSDSHILANYQPQFPNIVTYNPTDVFGDWDSIMQKFFKDGALFDQLTTQK